MQRRLLLAMIAVAGAARLALGIPLAIAISRLQVDEASQQLHHDAELTAKNLQIRLDSSQTPDPKQQAALLTDRYVVIRELVPGGYTVRVGIKPPPHDSMTETATTTTFQVSVTPDDSYVS